MRADLLTPVVEVAPGAPARLDLELLNTSDVIDEVVCALRGVDEARVVQSPAAVRLFPGEHALVSLLVDLPAGFHAGSHDQTVEVRGLASGESVEAHARLDVRTVVKPVLTVTPTLRVGGRRGRFEVLVDNRGNDDLDVVLRAVDTDQRLTMVIEPQRLRVAPGETGTARLTAGRRRRWFGAPVTHDVTVSAEQAPHTVTADVQLRQKPRIPAGALTALMLLAIVGLWAVAVLVGVRTAMAAPPVKRLIAASFFKGVDPSQLDPTVAGSSVTGKVANSVTGEPLARLTVELFDADGKLVAATATKDDGSWEVPGVLPGSYKVRLRGDGFAERWLPGVTDPAQAEAVTVPQDPKAAPPPALAVAGKPGGLTGLVLAGDGGGAVTVTVEPVDATDANRTGFPRVVAASAGKAFTVGELPAPASYRVRVTSGGFQTQEVEQEVAAGAVVQLNTLKLLASPGVVGGVVVDRAGVPLGDVTVSTIVGDKPVKVQTPTSGTVGRFRIEQLPSPGTYVLQFQREGYGAEVVAVQLGPGQDRDDVSVTLAAASGTVTGVVRGPDGAGIGGVRVALVGGASEVVTTTFTTGAVGAYRLSGLPLPGTYTLAFSFDATVPQTMQVTVAKDQPDATADVVLLPQLGRVTGTVLSTAGTAIGAATVEVSDGVTVRTSASATAPADALGTFDVPGLAPGSYTVTVRRAGYRDQTLLVRVEAGAVVARTLTLLDAA